MVKTIKILLDDEEFNALLRAKGDSVTWKEFFLTAVARYKKFYTKAKWLKWVKEQEKIRQKEMEWKKKALEKENEERRKEDLNLLKDIDHRPAY